MRNDNSGMFVVVFVVIIGLLSLLSIPSCVAYTNGIFPFGVTKSQTITVNRTWVDVGGGGGDQPSVSHYMVSSTDGSVYEVDNSIWLGITNADEIYGQLEAGKTYTVHVNGTRFVGYFFQEYPRIIKVEGEKPTENSRYHP